MSQPLRYRSLRALTLLNQVDTQDDDIHWDIDDESGFFRAWNDLMDRRSDALHDYE